MKFEWEKIDSWGQESGCCTWRAKVFNGWALRVMTWENTSNEEPATQSESMIFIPDPNYQWVIE